MPDRRDLIEIIEDAYEKRARGDKSAVDAIWAPGATYELFGGQTLLQQFPSGAADEATRAVIDLVEFHNHRRLEAVVEGDKAAVRWMVKLTVAGSPPADVQLFDLWTFDAAGKATSLVQFTDTALLDRLLREHG